MLMTEGDSVLTCESKNMSAVEQSPVMSLPTEILVKIFCYLDQEDIVNSTQYVCKTWNKVSHNFHVWRHRTYVPKDNEDIKVSFPKMPSLQHLVLEFPVPDSILNTIPRYFHLLTVFAYEQQKLPPCEFLANLRMHCPHLEALSLTLNRSLLKEVGKFDGLKHLEFSWFEKPRKSVRLKCIADGCPSLTSLSLKQIKAVKLCEFVYFMKKKKHQLEALRFSCWSLRECGLPYIKECQKLRKLDVECDCSGPAHTEGGLMLLRSMKTVVSLTLRFRSCLIKDCDCENAGARALLNVFENGGMCQVEEIEISELNSSRNEVLQIVMDNCPLLKKCTV